MEHQQENQSSLRIPLKEVLDRVIPPAIPETLENILANFRSSDVSFRGNAFTDEWYDAFMDRVDTVCDFVEAVMGFHCDLVDVLNKAPPGVLTDTQQDLKADSVKKLTLFKSIRKRLNRIAETAYSSLRGYGNENAPIDHCEILLKYYESLDFWKISF